MLNVYCRIEGIGDVVKKTEFPDHGDLKMLKLSDESKRKD
jgi:hypothetical protein